MWDRLKRVLGIGSGTRDSDEIIDSLYGSVVNRNLYFHLFIIIYELIMLFSISLRPGGPFVKPRRTAYFLLYLALILATACVVAGQAWIGRKKGSHRCYFRIEYGYMVFFSFWGLAITLNDQLGGNGLTVYNYVMLIMAIMSMMKPWASSCQGLIIPPSHNMVLYSMVAGGVSVGSLFCAGYIPGIMLGVFIMGMCYIISKKKHYPKGKKLPFKEALRVTKDTFFAMLAMVIIIGGVSAGFFTATESAAVACIYCLFVGFFIYRELRFKDIPVVLGNTIKTLSMVYALIAAAGAFGWVMAYLNVPTLATNLLLGISDNKIVVLLLINLILLLLGCVMDLAPLVLIMAPILLPVVTKFGMSPIQFGVMMMLNLGIGLCTPPVGTALFTGCAIGNMKIEKVSKAMLPLYIPMLITLLLVTFIPALTMTLPELIMK